MRRNTLVQATALLIKAFPTLQIDVDMWWLMLQDLPDAAVLEAVVALIRTQTDVFPGTNWVALIRQKTFRDSAPSIAEALSEVRDQIVKTGYVGTPKFSHARIKAAVDALGWHNICSSENPDVYRAHFMRVYEALGARQQQQALIGQMPKGIENLVKMIGKAHP